MPDICMCSNEECPLKDKCYRHTATPNEHRQAYSLFTPREIDSGETDDGVQWSLNECVHLLEIPEGC